MMADKISPTTLYDSSKEYPINSNILLMKLDIKNRIDELSYDDRLYVLEILKQQLPLSKIIENADGCRINLDTLTIDIINKIHHIIKLKLKISHDNLI